MSRIAAALASVLCASLLRAEPAAMVITGAGGTQGYAEQFSQWSEQWVAACRRGGVTPVSISSAETNDARARLLAALEQQTKDGDPLWLVLIGHGTYDGQVGKLNLSGDDLSAPQLADALRPFHRTVIVIAAFSASGAWLKPLAAPQRVVLVATKSGAENNFSRFGGYLAASIVDGPDLDKDGQISLLEAWLAADRKTAEFYQGAGRLATEHSLLDDTGDGQGTPAAWFQGTRVVKKPGTPAEVDGLRASQLFLVPGSFERSLSPERRGERDALERELASLRERKSTMTESAYLDAIESLLLELARIYRAAP